MLISALLLLNKCRIDGHKLLEMIAALHDAG